MNRELKEIFIKNILIITSMIPIIMMVEIIMSTIGNFIFWSIISILVFVFVSYISYKMDSFEKRKEIRIVNRKVRRAKKKILRVLRSRSSDFLGGIREKNIISNLLDKEISIIKTALHRLECDYVIDCEWDGNFCDRLNGNYENFTCGLLWRIRKR